MSKTQTQLITDLKHTVSLLEALNNGTGGNRQFDNSKGLEAINKGLKKKLSGLSRSRGQYKAMWETNTKQLNRLLTQNKNLSELVASLKEEIELQGFLKQAEFLQERNTVLEIENISLREQNNTLNLALVDQHSVKLTPYQIAVESEEIAAQQFNIKFKVGELIIYDDHFGKYFPAKIQEKAELSGGELSLVKIMDKTGKEHIVNTSLIKSIDTSKIFKSGAKIDIIKSTDMP